LPLADPAGRLGASFAALRRAASRLAGRDAAELVAISAEALGRYKLRTALSVLGVVLGVAAVIAMMSVSDGARREALAQMELLGLDNLVVRNGSPTGSPVAGSPEASAGLTLGDADALPRLVPLVAAVAPLVERWPNVSAAGRTRLAQALGVGPGYAQVLRLPLARGRFLTTLDERSRAHVCVLGATLSRALFGFRDPLAESVRLDEEWYRVVGVLADRGSDARAIGTIAARDLNQAVLLPVSTLLGATSESDPSQSIDEIWIQVRDGERVLELGAAVQHAVTRRHRGVADAEVVIPRELLNQRFRTQRTFSVVVGSVAVLSLLVGGIGIMNIMLASVLERTHEIGIRRTVGATRRDVTLQFLTESLLMTLSGGAAGIFTGVLVSFGITAYAGWSTSVSVYAVLLAFLVSFVVGLGFGIYPATKAAQLQPIDALRYE
jgi:putative ABC transport system permease protein